MNKTLQNYDWSEIKNFSMHKLHEKYSKYVLKIVNVYYFYYKETVIFGYEDLISIASVILIEAWQKYDWRKAISFKAYLRLYCKNFVRAYFKKNCLTPDELNESKINLDDLENNTNTAYYDPFKHYQIKENIQLVRKSLKSLKKSELKIIKLVLTQNSVTEISRLLKIKYENIFYVIKKFRSLLKNLGYIENFS